MNSYRLQVFGALLSLPLVFVGTSAADIISIDLTPPLLSGAPGDLLSFSGTLTNAATSTVFLNSAGVNLLGAFTPADEDLSGFFNNAPFFLSPGDATGGIDLFTIAIETPFVPGLYAGTFTVLGGADGDAQDVIGSANFTVHVTAGSTAPEPSTGALLVSACSVALIFRPLNRKRSMIATP